MEDLQEFVDRIPCETSPHKQVYDLMILNQIVMPSSIPVHLASNYQVFNALLYDVTTYCCSFGFWELEVSRCVSICFSRTPLIRTKLSSKRWATAYSSSYSPFRLFSYLASKKSKYVLLALPYSFRSFFRMLKPSLPYGWFLKKWWRMSTTASRRYLIFQLFCIQDVLTVFK